MCGIVGLYSPEGFDRSQAESRLRAAADALAHRGPDASGVSSLSEHGVGFAHRRLSILDLDPRANQPMASADGRILLTFNGEIYNFKELREELRRLGASFRTESDSEVLIEGYRAWGLDGLLSKAAGMFAFGLYDAKEKVLFLARDRAGKKPLFYAEDGKRLAFASEIRALLRLGTAPSLDPAGLDAYLALKFVPSPGTLFKGIRKVPPGFYLSRRAGEAPKLKRYWHPFSSKLAPQGAAELKDRIEAAFTTALKRRLVSDVPICLFLSGGIDSSLVAAGLKRLGASGMRAYSIGYGDLPGYDEFEYSRMVASKSGVDYREVILDSGGARELLQDESLILDEPVSDWVWVPLYHLSRQARADGFKVVLVGEGSDEIFFGYDVMMKGLRDLRLFQRPGMRALARLGAAALAPVYRHSPRGHRRYDLWRRVAEGGPVYMGSSVGFGKSLRPQVAGPRLAEAGDPDVGEAFIAHLQHAYGDFSEGGDLVNRICYVEFYGKMSEVLLSRVDRVSMLHSLEARSPYLDHELVELAFSIPGPLKISQERLKGALKDFARELLPAPVVDRKKMGFSFPFKEWLRGDLGAVVERSFNETKLFSDGWVDGGFCRRMLKEHRSGYVDHAPRVWAMYSLARWYDRWIAGKGAI